LLRHALAERLRSWPVLYEPWRRYREWQELTAFRRILDAYLGSELHPDALPYSSTIVGERLKAKRADRRPFLGPDGKAHVVAFGARQWEQYGLWPTFARLCHFALSEYGTEHIIGPTIRTPRSVTRQQQGDGFLAFIDAREREAQLPVSCAFFYASGAHISDRLLSELTRRGIWTVIMSLDDKQQFIRPVDEKGEPHQIRVARQCDLYWTTWKTGTQIVQNLGGTPWYAPEGADPAYHHPVQLNKDIEILFIGQSYGKRRALVDYLRRRGFQVETFGWGWPNGYVSFEKTLELYNRAQIVLGFGGVGQMQGVKHLKGRDFEVPMCGALYLTSYNPELADWFEIGSEILCYSSFEECADILHWILRNPGEAGKIRLAARGRCMSRNTWEHRLNLLFSLLSLPRKARRAIS